MNNQLLELISDVNIALRQLEGYCAENGIQEKIDLETIHDALETWANKLRGNA